MYSIVSVLLAEGSKPRYTSVQHCLDSFVYGCVILNTVSPPNLTKVSVTKSLNFYLIINTFFGFSVYLRSFLYPQSHSSVNPASEGVK